MTNEERKYVEGYRNALENVDQTITHHIKQNGGAMSPLQILNVFNATMAHIQSELTNVRYQLEDIPYGKDDDTLEAILEDALHQVMSMVNRKEKR